MIFLQKIVIHPFWFLRDMFFRDILTFLKNGREKGEKYVVMKKCVEIVNNYLQKLFHMKK